MSEKTRRTILNLVLVAVILSAFGATAWFYLSQYDRFDRESVHAFISGFGPWAPLVYAALYILSAPIPFVAPVLSAVGGLLFGAGLGTLYTLLIATASAFVPFMMARRLGREWVEARLKGKKLDDIYQRSEGKGGFMFIVLLRLIPLLPWEIQNYVAGITRVGPLTFALGTILGIIPGTFSLAFLGSAITDPTSWKFYAAIALKIATALIPTSYGLIRAYRARQKAQQSSPIPKDTHGVGPVAPHEVSQ